MARRTAADCLVDVLRAWRVEVVFGPTEDAGGACTGIRESLRRRDDEIRYVDVRHEDAAALMACGYARFTGRLGVCIGRPGPQGARLLDGLHDATLDGQPVVAITGERPRHAGDPLGSGGIDLGRLFADLVVHGARFAADARVEDVAMLACRAAVTRRGAVHLVFPADLQDRPTAERSRCRPDRPVAWSRDGWPGPTVDEVQAAAALLNGGRRIAILAGRGALDAVDELEAVAETLGAPIIKTLAGKAAVPDDSPYTTGGLDLPGSDASRQALTACDTLLLVGASLSRLPSPGGTHARIVQIDVDPVRIGLRQAVDVGIVGAGRATLNALIPHLRRNPDRAFLEWARHAEGAWADSERDRPKGLPAGAGGVARELGRRLAADAIVSADASERSAWFASRIPVRRGQTFALASSPDPMPTGLPYAMAAQIAHPARPSIACVTGPALVRFAGELATAAGARLPVKVIAVGEDAIDLSHLAAACGAAVHRLDDLHACGGVLDRALNEPGPVVMLMGGEATARPAAEIPVDARAC
jgi:pyruvate dehydrogenase (quinone)